MIAPRAILIAAAVAALLPLAATGQQPGKVHRIGVLEFAAIPNPHYEAFQEGMRDLNYIEGRNVEYVTRTAERAFDRLSRLAQELAAAKVDVIVAATGLSTLAVKRATSGIPIVMRASSDAVTMGIVQSLARPGGNVTGMTIISPELAPKRLELLTSIPNLTRIAVPWCPGLSATVDEVEATRAAAARLGVELETVEYVQGVTAWRSIRDALIRARARALFLPDCPLLPLEEIVEFAIEHRLPTITPYVVVAGRGALLAYGPDPAAMARRAASFVDRILKGANPADLPVEQPTKFELVVNLRTAKALGITVPQSLLLRADRVIE